MNSNFECPKNMSKGNLPSLENASWNIFFFVDDLNSKKLHFIIYSQLTQILKLIVDLYNLISFCKYSRCIVQF